MQPNPNAPINLSMPLSKVPYTRTPNPNPKNANQLPTTFTLAVAAPTLGVAEASSPVNDCVPLLSLLLLSRPLLDPVASAVTLEEADEDAR